MPTTVRIVVMTKPLAKPSLPLAVRLSSRTRKLKARACTRLTARATPSLSSELISSAIRAC